LKNPLSPFWKKNETLEHRDQAYHLFVTRML